MPDITKSLASMFSEMGIDAGTQKLLTGRYEVTGTFVTTQVQGLAELERALDALPEKVAKKTLVDAVRDAAELFRASAISLAPSDPSVQLGHPKWRTLHLRDGILKKVTTKNLGAAGARVRGEVALDKAHAFFGRYLEFGWITARGKKQVAPHPFMRPAFEATKDAALTLFETRLASGIEAAARELGP